MKVCRAGALILALVLVPWHLAGQTIEERREARSLGAATVIVDFHGAQSVADLLQWHVPGLHVERGRDGGIRLWIRGLDSPPPLLVVDGMPTDSSMTAWALGLHPSQVERVEVLRDVASTVVYGTKAAGGVVLIHLKRR